MYEPYVIICILLIAFVAICAAIWITNTAKNRCNAKKKPKAYAKTCKVSFVLATTQLFVLLFLTHFTSFFWMKICLMIVAAFFMFVWVNTLTNYIKALINCDKKAEKKTDEDDEE